MLKRLAILAVVLTSFGSLEPIPGQTANGGDQGPNQPEKQAENSKNPAKPVAASSVPQKVVPKDCNSEALKNDPDCNKREDKPTAIVVSEFPAANISVQRDIYDWIAYWPSVGLSIAGIVAVVIGYFTLKWLKVQTLATKAAVESARDNTNALIDSERAWMIVKPEGDILTGSFKAVASNQGRTPATVVSWEYGYGMASPPNWDLQQIPNYFGQMPWMKGILIAPQNQFEAMHNPDVLLRAFYDRASDLDQLCIYGRIVYWHTFSERKETDTPCETRWCFRFRADVRDYIPYGGEYDRAT